MLVRPRVEASARTCPRGSYHLARSPLVHSGRERLARSYPVGGAARSCGDRSQTISSTTSMPRHDVIRARDLKVSKMVQRSFDNVRAVRPVPKSLIERALWPGPTTRRHSDGQDIDGIWRHCTLQQLQRFVALYQIGARQSHGDFCRSRRVKQDDARWLLDEVGGRMRKSVYFDAFDGPGWPSPSQLQPYFLGPRERRWIFARRNDC